MAKLPAFQFYPADWRKDPAVQSLSYFDRGVWLEILCLMHESEQRGKLLLNGKKMPNEALARLLGLDKQILTKTLDTLIEYGVASIDEVTEALISRRMVRDEEIRRIRTEAGKKGGNPNLLNQNSNQTASKNKNEDNQISTPSVSASATFSSEEEKDSGKLGQTAAANSSGHSPRESDAEYLERKQREFPELDVEQIFNHFVTLCGSEKYPNLKNNRKQFDKWLEKEEKPIAAVGSNGYRNPATGKGLK